MNATTIRPWFISLSCLIIAASGGSPSGWQSSGCLRSNQIANQSNKSSAKQSKSLFDGKSLSGWAITDFGGQDNVRVDNGAILVEMGYPLAGITYDGEFPNTDYEISLEAKKVQGTDFFCCLTLPVGDEFFSFVVGGWGGSLTGISCIDGVDASDNKTKLNRKYDRDRWYAICVAVDQSRIRCWIDGEKLVDLDHTKHKLSLRAEVEPCKPAGICSFETRAAYKNIRLRKLKR